MHIPAPYWSLTIHYDATKAPNDTQILPCPGNMPIGEIITTLRGIADQLQAQLDAAQAQPAALPPQAFAAPPQEQQEEDGATGEAA